MARGACDLCVFFFLECCVRCLNSARAVEARFFYFDWEDSNHVTSVASFTSRWSVVLEVQCWFCCAELHNIPAAGAQHPQARICDMILARGRLAARVDDVHPEVSMSEPWRSLNFLCVLERVSETTARRKMSSPERSVEAAWL